MFCVRILAWPSTELSLSSAAKAKQRHKKKTKKNAVFVVLDKGFSEKKREEEGEGK